MLPPKLERIWPHEMSALKHARTFHVLLEAREISGQNKNPACCLGSHRKRTFPHVCAMSALPPKAEIVGRNGDVRFVPKADSCTAATDSHIQRRTRAT